MTLNDLSQVWDDFQIMWEVNGFTVGRGKLIYNAWDISPNGTFRLYRDREDGTVDGSRYVLPDVFVHIVPFTEKQAWQ